ncbi:MAG: hypothetical protein ACYDBJ_19820 [Aggregatilineales bacterium]
MKRGFRRDEISLMANASSSEYAKYFRPDANPTPMPATDRPLTAGEGAGMGATVGAITGIVIGLASFVIPGIGPVIGAGPLIAGLTGGAVGVIAGAATGGIAAGLIEAGVPQEEAHLYEESIRRGGTLVAVQSPETAMDTVQKIMRDYHAVDVVQRRTEWQSDTSSATNAGYVSTRQTYPVGGITFETFDPDYRKHYDAHYANTEFTYSQFVPFYRYGYDLATDPRYASATWDEVETDIRPGWEALNPNSVWSNFRDAVRYGWETVRGTH